MTSTEEFYICPCNQCGVRFAITDDFKTARLRDARTFYCPNGHALSWAKSEADQLRERLQKAERAASEAAQRAEQERRWRLESHEERKALERRLAAQRGVTTRIKNRVANGVCPCCNRTFVNLQRHMATKHAGFVAEEVQAEVGQTIR